MARHAFAFGEAGTGKTTWLIGQINERAPRLLLADHHRVLALSFMHGARRRLESAIKQSCKGIRATVTTIDAFALDIVNRWRASFDSALPIVPSAVSRNFETEFFGVYADFNSIVDRAVQLLRSPTVTKIIAATYPLIVIDEFQDCHGSRLDFVKSLATACPLLAAADPFQLLDSTVIGCPSADWTSEVRRNGQAHVEELSTIHRTSNAGILDAAHSLRTQTSLNRPTVPILCFPKEGPAAFKLIEMLHFNQGSQPRHKSVALISPSRDGTADKIIDSYKKQAIKRRFSPVTWDVEGSEENEVTRLVNSLTGSSSDGLDVRALNKNRTDSDVIRGTVTDRLSRLAHLKGLSWIPAALVKECAQRTVHSLRAYGPARSRRVVTTVHQAKNREFDHIFVIWPFRVTPDKVAQRRLLYNAITRAKESCVLLVQGGADRVKKCSVLSLLGEARPVFTQEKKPKRRKPVAPTVSS